MTRLREIATKEEMKTAVNELLSVCMPHSPPRMLPQPVGVYTITLSAQ